MTHPEVAAVAERSVIILSVGSTEQHGPHLPLFTDSIMTIALAEALATRRAESTLLAPSVNFGSSGEHSSFAGTLSIGQNALELVLLELGRSVDHFAGIIFVTAHGGNVEAMAKAVQKLRSEGRFATAWWPTLEILQKAAYRWSGPGGAQGMEAPDLHAGRTETSAMLALVPELVQMSLARPGSVAEPSEIMEVMRNLGVSAVSKNGVLGDPTGSSATEGAAILGAFSDALIETYDRFYKSIPPKAINWPTL